MIIFEQTFRDLLLRTNLVGSRVFLARGPQVPADMQKAPYMVFFMVGPLPMMTQTGPLNQIQRDYQVSIFDLSQSRAWAIGDSLRMYMDGLRGDFENVHLGSVFYMSQTWGREPDTELFSVIQDYRIMFSYLQPAAPPVTPSRSKTA